MNSPRPLRRKKTHISRGAGSHTTPLPMERTTVSSALSSSASVFLRQQLNSKGVPFVSLLRRQRAPDGTQPLPVLFPGVLPPYFIPTYAQNKLLSETDRDNFFP